MSAELDLRRALKEGQIYERQLLVARAVLYDAQTYGERTESSAARRGLIRAATVLIEIACDYQCAADMGPHATAAEVVTWLLGACLTREDI